MWLVHACILVKKNISCPAVGMFLFKKKRSWIWSSMLNFCFPRTGFLGSLLGRASEECRCQWGQNQSTAGQDVWKLPVTSQKDDAALLLCAGTREAHAENRSRSPAPGFLRALRPAWLRPLHPPGAGEGLQAAGAHCVRCHRGAHVWADSSVQAGWHRLAQPTGLPFYGDLLCPDFQARTQTESWFPARQEKIVLLRGWYCDRGVLNYGRVGVGYRVSCGLNALLPKCKWHSSGVIFSTVFLYNTVCQFDYS